MAKGITRKVVVVLGMHRSGTSAIAKGLGVLGGDLGNNLHPAGPDNPKGFWEDREFLEINEKLLAHLGSAYDRIFPWSGTVSEQNDTADSLKLDAVKLTIQRTQKSEAFWAVKDPRACRLLPFWLGVFAELSCDLSFVVVARNPLSVAQSLFARNALSATKSYILWLQHMVPAITHTSGYKRVIVDYDLFLDDPSGQLMRLAQGIGLKAPDRDCDTYREYGESFLENSLRHSRFDVSQLEHDNRAIGELSIAYRLLLEASNTDPDGDSATLNEAFKKIALSLERYSPVLAQTNSLEDDLRSLQLRYKELEECVKSLTDNVLEKERQLLQEQQGIQNIGDHQQVLLSQINELSQGLSTKNELLIRQSELLEERAAHVLTANARVEELNRLVAARTEQIALQSARLEEKGALHLALASRMEEVKAVLSERTSKLAEQSLLIETDAEQISALHRRIEQIQQDAHELDLALTVARSENARLALQHQSDVVELDVLRSSNRELTERVSLADTQTQTLQEQVAATSVELQVLRVERSAQGEQLLQNEYAVAELTRQVTAGQASLIEIRSSNSWRMTAAFRALRNVIRQFSRNAKSAAATTAFRAYRKLPLSQEVKIRIKSKLFNSLRPLAVHTAAYARWESFQNQGSNRVRLSENDRLSRASAVQFQQHEREEVPEGLRLVAFYLPQYHPTPENDAWWEPGFTEWTNVTRAVPQFEGHYQPHLPADLGFYDLRVPEVQRRQVELAKNYGLNGFCFYFYWFNGRRLLEKPLLQYLNDTSLDLPFCLCWANENWSRRWNGEDNDVLIGQQHSAEDDIAFIEYLASYLNDPRYIRIDGKPVLLVYRPSLLPNARETATRWRARCRENGVGEIYLVYTQSFDKVDPATIGFDAAVEFPPNNTAPTRVFSGINLINQEYSGHIYDWQCFVERSRCYADTEYKLFRGVCPSWDNEARRRGHGTVFINSTPDAYTEWLANACKDTVRRFASRDERLVFINAWNEWAEGAHLEPDQKYGYAWLQATRDALQSLRPLDARLDRKIVVVTHDAYLHGAQYLALYLSRMLVNEFGFTVELVTLGDGPLLEQFAACSNLHSLSGYSHTGPQAEAIARLLYDSGCRQAIVNTTVSGKYLATLTKAGISCISLVHELPGVIDQLGMRESVASIALYARTVVFPDDFVRAAFLEMSGDISSKTIIRPQGLSRPNKLRGGDPAVRHRLRSSLGLPDEAEIVLSIAYADHRKGIDLFVDVARKLLDERKDCHFVWIGHWEQTMQDQLLPNLADISSRLHLLPFSEETDLFYAGSDLYLLTSREDPFPTVVVEALDVGLPVIGFSGAGGFASLLARGCGVLVESGSTEEMARAVLDLLSNPDKAKKMGVLGAQIISAEFSFRQYVSDLLALVEIKPARVSVVVPNYNYARYLGDRLGSIINQTRPVFELIVLDDASTDDSISVIKQCLSDCPIAARIVVNDVNSGSVFSQWAKGVSLAEGEYVWICEADDLAEPEFLETSLTLLQQDDSISLVYCQSRQIDETGREISPNYLHYTDDIDKDRWRSNYVVAGITEIESCMAIKNTIPNVSAVLFRAGPLRQVLNSNVWKALKVAGDWLIFAEVIRSSRVAYVAKALNFHRRHLKSATQELSSARHIAEILYVQRVLASVVSTDANTVLKARSYAEACYKHLGLGRSPGILERDPRVLEQLQLL